MEQDTKIITINRDEPLEKQLKIAGQLLAEGKLVAFPTETVYGLGANGLSGEAVTKIFKAKGRPQDNPLILHIADRDSLAPLVAKVPPVAEPLMDAFWPGPLTLVFPKSDLIPQEVTAGLDTVAIRMPDHPVALALLKAAAVPVAAPSANLSGKPSPTEAAHVYNDLQGKVEAIVNGGPTEVGLESTVLDITGEVPVILRPGSITLDMLQEVVEKVEIDPNLAIGDGGGAPKAPGMKYTHYAPEAQVVLVKGPEVRQVANKILALVEQGKRDKLKVAVMISEEAVDREIDLLTAPDQAFVLGSRDDMEEVGRQIYRVLRECDQLGIELIVVEAYPPTGVGLAVMNRLDKAAAFQTVHV
ncbi:MAG: L-threonylcarbamoyladenylate synthase [Bacillota bacterium]|nr:L-threonylcarbamoyladenylate synthase [Bacillota bacterium]